MKIKIVFFGSFQHYSSLILEALIKTDFIEILGVVTTPPKVAGRQKILKKTPVQETAEKYDLAVFTPENLNLPAGEITPKNILENKPDLFVVAGYGKLLPKTWLDFPKLASLNLHFSLLPKYRGANPAEWAILRSETETGITLIEMSEKLDAGEILAQAEIPIKNNDTRETLYDKLYTLGAEKLPSWISDYVAGSLEATPQPELSPTPYAKRLGREDGFVPWKVIDKAMTGKKINEKSNFELRTWDLELIARAVRALHGFPDVWTLIPTSKDEKRMKILSCLVQDGKLLLKRVQIEGQDKANWNQVKNILS